jgi:TorA maturation chaperone TorD
MEIADERWAELPANTCSALVRSDAYRALAWAFLYPEACTFTSVNRTIMHVTDRADDLPTHAVTIAAFELLKQFNHATIEQLRLDHDRIFGHTISTDCPPYETQYGTGIIFAQAQRMADITAFYRAFGLQLSPHAHERHDHIAAELEFMSLMAFREATASIENDVDHLAAIREAERKFVVEHLGPWALGFAERLGRKARLIAPPGGGSYAALAAALESMLHDELRLFQVTPESIGHIEPAKIDFEPEGCSFACGAVGEPVLANLPGFNV